MVDFNQKVNSAQLRYTRAKWRDSPFSPNPVLFLMRSSIAPGFLEASGNKPGLHRGDLIDKLPVVVVSLYCWDVADWVRAGDGGSELPSRPTDNSMSD